ncbi:MAG: twitching motility protein PilT [Planctomycetes bacterium RBG_16_55_9]|nr:MAG: twitching motility protein PilT [Planctomycetes bacterium RBG_16_55_9]
MIFDTDILIWIQRRNEKASHVVDQSIDRYISIVTYMELLQAATSKRQHECVLDFLKEFGFQILPLTESIGHRAAVYIEEYSLAYGIGAVDAIIAATAIEHHLPLCSGNAKHFKAIEGLKLKVFRP